MLKWIGRLFLLGLITMIAMGAWGYFYLKSMEPPKIEDAPWAIQTYSQDGMMIPSRVYYASAVTIVNGEFVIEDYWVLAGDRFKRVRDEKILPENSKIVRRRQ